METIYDWLLYNTGNAGNYYTILNTQRDGSEYLEVMARLQNFHVVNLFIQETDNSEPTENQNDTLSEKVIKNNYLFSSEQQVINYLAEGKTPESQQSDNATGIRVLVAEPEGEAGTITFPPTPI